MKHLSEHYEYLLLGKITDTLTPEEEKEVAQLLIENSVLQERYEELIGQLPAEQVKTSFKHLNNKGYWRDLTTELGERKNTSRSSNITFFRKMAAASVVCIIAVSGWLIYRQVQNNSRVKESIVSSTKKPGVYLQLANGKTIDLSSETGKIEERGAQLENKDKSLSYTITGKEVEGINRIIVPVGMDYKISLNDGTQVWLNAATQLEFPFSFAGNTREITIRGEAYVQVAKNAAKPFIVHLPGSTVQVLGTEFNVNTYDSGMVKVALVEGSVNMQSASGSLELTPGKEGVFSNGKNIQQRTFDARYVLSWRKGLYYFDEATLNEISKVVPRWFGIRTVIDNPSLNIKKFVGVLDRNQPISVFQDDLKVISGIDSWIDKDSTLHFK
jgi:hypothetical protein